VKSEQQAEAVERALGGPTVLTVDPRALADWITISCGHSALAGKGSFKVGDVLSAGCWKCSEGLPINHQSDNYGSSFGQLLRVTK
jgi:hypothetical protein